MKRTNLVTVILLGAMLLGAGLIYRVFSANGVVPSASSISGAEQEAVGPVIPEVTLPTLDDVSLEHLQTLIDAVGENRLTWAFDPEVQFMRRFNVQALDTTRRSPGFARSALAANHDALVAYTYGRYACSPGAPVCAV